jgi:CBS domain-containing protein
MFPHLDHATVADAMHPGTLSCAMDATLSDVARIMSTQHVHCVAVRGGAADPADDAPGWNIISDFDVVEAEMRLDGPNTVAALALQPAVTVRTTDALRGAVELMLDRSTSHVVAVNPESEVAVRILCTLDVAGVLAWGER